MRLLMLLIVAATLLVVVPTLCGQAKTVTEADLTKMVSDAKEKRKGLSYRQKTYTSGYARGDHSETTSEFGPNNTFHMVSVSTSEGVETKTETIRIGSIRYDRGKDGTWKKLTPPSGRSGQGSGIGAGNGTGSAPAKPPKMKVEYRFVGIDKINGTKASHYRKTQKITVTTTNPPTTRVVIEDYWFLEDGLLVKESHEDALNIFNLDIKQPYKSTTDYEYDNTIQITAPIPD